LVKKVYLYFINLKIIRVFTADIAKTTPITHLGDYDDKAMLNQTLDGLRSTIQSIRDAKKAALNETKSYDPKKAEQRIELYDALAEKSSFTIPNPKELAYENQKLDRKHQPDITLWKEIEDRREDLLWQLSFWSLSYCKFAPNIKPWSMAIDPQKAVIETQDIKPGIFKEKEKLFKKYFNISFLDIFNHPSFEWKVKHFTIDYSQEYVEFLIKKVYPECKPFNHLPKDIISEKETNPETHFILDNFKKFYDEKFGEGRFESKFPTPEYPECKAAIWNFDDFKQHL